MSKRLDAVTSFAVAALVPVFGACAPVMARPPEPPPPPPPLLVEQVSSDPAPGPLLPEAAPTTGRLVTLTTAEADVRDILPVLAQAAGISLVLAPDVAGRVSVRLVNVPAEDALRIVVREAGLTIDAPSRATTEPNVFHQPMVNVNVAPPPVISARFDVSERLAAFTAASRTLTLRRID